MNGWQIATAVYLFCALVVFIALLASAAAAKAADERQHDEWTCPRCHDDEGQAA